LRERGSTAILRYQRLLFVGRVVINCNICLSAAGEDALVKDEFASMFWADDGRGEEAHVMM
jgi:hypothetical protein